MIAPGAMLGGRYRLEERIASGGMGDVWKGTDEVLGRTVAVKILLPALLDEHGFAERFRGEARTMATVNHPGVVDIYDYGSDTQVAFLVMEYVEGDALSRTLGKVGRLTPARTMALVAQAADALHAAHQKGIVHRDVKPGNLLVRPNGTLVLTDFGIARSDMVGSLTVAGSVLGTAAYISPEQASGETATPASDVYALGVVAYQCLSGRRPFEGDNPLDIAMRHVRDTPRPLPADIPPAARAIVERAMSKAPAGRFPSAAAMAVAARQAAAALANTPRPANRPSSGAPITGRVSAPPATGPASPTSPAAVGVPGPQHGVPGPQHGMAPPISGQPVSSGPAAPFRAAATVPPPVGAPQQVPHYAPMYPPPAGGSTSRQVLIVLAIVLGLLVLLCAGVIAWLAGRNNPVALGAPPGVTRVVTATGTDILPAASYRRDERIDPDRAIENDRPVPHVFNDQAGGEPAPGTNELPMTEGRQTR
ncbi:MULTISPECIES: serine/threonine-protein kinase [Catenuloplanes]|uniref:non-specific serine/threonine protein kinase n=1 Tax=Catenuloplanes niger TaxID=587534 RepID=A0AAE4CS22_9ACTN|nr:protein kinase [Catenuloplanes niger]MDR7323621.1 serine/threonine-protein kinase [Catenuloplanes niger]